MQTSDPSSNSFPLILSDVQYDLDLVELCRIAAWLGYTDQAEPPISFNTLLAAFVYGRDPVSIWFQKFLVESRPMMGELIPRNITRMDPNKAVELARSNQVPDVLQMFTHSVRALFEEAVVVARDAAPDTPPPIQLGCHHIMAVFAFSVSSLHLVDIRNWGMNVEVWRAELNKFLLTEHPQALWGPIQAALARIDGNVNDPPPAEITNPVSNLAQAFARRSANEARGLTRTLVGGYTADDPNKATDDLIGVDDEAAAFARLIAARSIHPPLAIGIFGEWGAGKSYFMRRIQEHVEAISTQGSTRSDFFLSHIVPIRFNAWHYIETNLWASLVEYLFSALHDWIQQQARGQSVDTEFIFNRLATAQQLQIDALETVVARRSEQQAADQRAQRAREQYNKALVRSQQLGPKVLLLAMVETFLSTDKQAKSDIDRIAGDLGISDLSNASERLTEVVMQSRDEVGRGRLLWQSILAKVGTVKGIVLIGVAAIGIPLVAAWLGELASQSGSSPLIRALHNSAVPWTTLLVGLGASLNYLRQAAKKTIDSLTEFDQRLQRSIDSQSRAVQSSAAMRNALESEKELQSRRLALEAAEKTLADANAQLSAARRDFDSGTARGRLNAFIRAKVVDGAYAKHLGIIASIRKDFAQLAALIGDSAQNTEDERQSEKLRVEARTRVERFLNWLEGASTVELAASEAFSLLAMLDSSDVDSTLAQFKTLLESRIEGGARELNRLAADLAKRSAAKVPHFSRIVLYIDDLDRCPPEKVIDVLQAVHLLLCFPLFVVIVAVDVRWVSRALHDRFPGLLADSRDFTTWKETSTPLRAPLSGASSYDYLEKIFQVPYWVRSMDREIASLYVSRLVDRFRVSEVDASRSNDASTAPAEPATAKSDSASISSVTPASGEEPRTESASGASSKDETAGQRIDDFTGMVLTGHEREQLDRFAPYVGSTPRQILRFFNIYRLIKSSMRPSLRTELDMEGGSNATGLTLIAQLAIVTGAPRSAKRFFELTASRETDMVLEQLISVWKERAESAEVDGQVVTEALNELSALRSERGLDSSLIRVKDMIVPARIVQRYSFAARI